MIYELLTGKLPFSAETPMAVILKHINDPVPSLFALKPGLPKAIDDVISKAMAKRPEERYLTATELSRALAAAVGPATDNPAVLQAAATQTIADLAKIREEAKRLGFNTEPGSAGNGG